MVVSRRQKSKVQFIWGVALLIVGVAVFFRTPQVMPKLQAMNHAPTTLVFIRICFYLMGIILVGGGARKILHHFSSSSSSAAQPDIDTDMDGKDR